MERTPNLPKMYTVVEASKIIGVKPRTLRAWIREDRINAVKYPNGNRWYIKYEDIKKITEGQSKYEH